MDKRLFVMFLFLVSGFQLMAQPKGYVAVTNNTEFRKRMSEAAAKTNSVKSDFTQEKNLNVLDEKIVSKGIFRFKKQKKVRMEYVTPFKYLFIINGEKVTIKDSQKSSSFSARSNKLFTVINNIIIDCIQGTALDNKDFTSTVFENDKNYLIVLKPVKKELKEYFNDISVSLDKKDLSVSKIDMVEPSGDNTEILFQNKEINATIPDAEFISD